jgi:hypothetical protein
MSLAFTSLLEAYQPTNPPIRRRFKESRDEGEFASNVRHKGDYAEATASTATDECERV